MIWGVVGGAFIIEWGVGWGYLRRSVGRCMLALGLDRSERGFEKVVELVGVLVEGDGSESANSSGVSMSELLNCEIVV